MIVESRLYVRAHISRITVEEHIFLDPIMTPPWRASRCRRFGHVVVLKVLPVSEVARVYAVVGKLFVGDGR